MNEIKAIVVDDEPKSRQVLIELLKLFCPHVDVIEEAGSINEAVDKINDHQPQLVFFDILLKEGDSFEIINRINEVNFEMIFVTAFDEDSVKALKFSGAKVLLKPIQISDLVDAVKSVSKQNGKSYLRYKMADGVLKSKFKTIPMVTSSGLIFKEIQDILYASNRKKGSEITFKDGSRTKSERTINELFEVIDSNQFIITADLLINKSLLHEHDSENQELHFKDGSSYPY